MVRQAVRHWRDRKQSGYWTEVCVCVCEELGKVLLRIPEGN